MNTIGLIPEWQTDAACLGSHLDFFHLQESNKPALKAACASCKVADECLEYALLERQEDGWWAGTTPNQRRGMLEKSDSPAAREILDHIAKYARNQESK